MSESAENGKPEQPGSGGMSTAEALGKFLSYCLEHRKRLVVVTGDDIQVDKDVSRKIDNHDFALPESKRLAIRTACQVADEGYLVEVYFVGFDTPGMNTTDSVWIFRIVNGPAIRSAFIFEKEIREIDEQGYRAKVRLAIRDIRKHGVHVGPRDSKN